MNRVFLLLGSNMNEPELMIDKARQEIEKHIGKIRHRSSLYRTAAWGNKNQSDFINQVLEAETKLDAGRLMNTILDIEEAMGRIRTVKNAPRIIDVDILFFNREIIKNDDLIIPHPQLANRRFALTPLAEVAPAIIHPELNISVEEMLINCTDSLPVEKI